MEEVLCWVFHSDGFPMRFDNSTSKDQSKSNCTVFNEIHY